jgi:hypothetical protein
VPLLDVLVSQFYFRLHVVSVFRQWLVFDSLAEASMRPLLVHFRSAFSHDDDVLWKEVPLIRNYRNTHANILIVYFTRRCPIQYHWTLKKLQPRSSATIVNRSSVYMPYASMYFPCRRLAPMLFSTCSRDSDSCVNLLLLFKLTTFQLYFTDRELFFLNIFSSGVFHRVECGADRAADSILSVA